LIKFQRQEFLELREFLNLLVLFGALGIKFVFWEEIEVALAENVIASQLNI
jgi:hypothetical protein